MKIVCFHLFNDYSGSPKVLHGVIAGLLDRGFEVDLITSKGGVLDTLNHPNLKIRHYSYKFSTNPALTMLRYAGVQLQTFVMALRYAFKKNTTFYINTILPIGPAMAGRMLGKRVVYHYHENAMVKSSFYCILCGTMQRIANHIICVSDYQASFLKRKDNRMVIPNTLDDEFLKKLNPDINSAFGRKTVLMLSSLKAYKGTKEFLELAAMLPQLRFELVINDTHSAIESWLKAEKIVPTENVRLHPRTNNVAAHYNSASVVLNLSNPELFIETFGLTALEAMAAALPVIVPPVGGIAEMVEDGVNGYRIDCHDTSQLIEAISEILTDRELYSRLANNALSISQKYSKENALNSLTKIINL